MYQLGLAVYACTNIEFANTISWLLHSPSFSMNVKEVCFDLGGFKCYGSGNCHTSAENFLVPQMDRDMQSVTLQF